MSHGAIILPSIRNTRSSESVLGIQELYYVSKAVELNRFSQVKSYIHWQVKSRSLSFETSQLDVKQVKVLFTGLL